VTPARYPNSLRHWLEILGTNTAIISTEFSTKWKKRNLPTFRSLRFTSEIAGLKAFTLGEFSSGFSIGTPPAIKSLQ
jgi:hypothetical protein